MSTTFPGWPDVLGQVTAGRDLDADVARGAMAQILAGEATPAQIAAFVVAMRMKGETVAELVALREAMLDAAERIPLPAGPVTVDTCGTGGDRAGTINVSSIAALVLAGGGVRVLKHGNRAASSKCGSADVYEALGITIDLGPEDLMACVAETGFGFALAPRYHPSMRHAGPPRRELGIPTAFNLLGPIANPAGVRHQVVGVADAAVADRLLAVLAATGAEHAMVVHGDDGLDELTTTTTSTVHELRDGVMTTTTVDPVDLGLAKATAEQLAGDDATTNAEAARRVLAGDSGPHRDIVVLNAAAGFVVAGEADDLAAGVARAATVIDEGRAAATLDAVVAAGRRLAG